MKSVQSSRIYSQNGTCPGDLPLEDLLPVLDLQGNHLAEDGGAKKGSLCCPQAGQVGVDVDVAQEVAIAASPQADFLAKQTQVHFFFKSVSLQERALESMKA